MHRTASFLLAVALASALVGVGVAIAADRCEFNAMEHRLDCSASGQTTEHPGPERSPLRYVYVTTMPGVGDCYYASRRPGGVDTWDPANDPTTIDILTHLPRCPAADPRTRAWAIFRSFPLAAPEPSFEPPGTGVAGLPVYLTARVADPLRHEEVLPDGRVLRVEATVVGLDVDWGDGSTGRFRPGAARPFPDGGVTHPFRYRTCAPEERGVVGGGPCHPTLAAYRIAATWVWEGRYRIGGPWIPLGSLRRTTVRSYPVDEVQGVLQP